MDGPCALVSVPRRANGPALQGFRSFVIAATAMTASMLVPAAAAQEPFIPFIEGLRERGYFDTAVEYIDGLSQRSDLPVEVREVLDLQRGLTLQQRGSRSRISEDRDQYLTQAGQALNRFIADHPQHPEVAQAYAMLGELLFDQARTLIWKSDDTDQADERSSLQQQARVLIDQAESIYQKATDEYKARWMAFPKFIDMDKDTEHWEKRQSAETKYLGAWYNLSRCMYERGQTYDKGSPDRKATLDKAAILFEKIHSDFRLTPIGLMSRLMMGKCFQEQDDLGKALGLYNEVREQKSAVTQGISAMAQHFRLICLNSPPRNDHTLVVIEASLWIQENRALVTSETGLGILWERAIAQEKLAENREIAEKEQQLILRAAMNDATQVARTFGPYREPANAMSRRLKLLLGDKDREPRDFATAFERAKGMISQVQQLRDDLAKATDSTERAAKQIQLDNHLTEVGRLLQLALDLRDSDSDPKAIAQSRYLLSYVMLQQGKALDAVVLSSYCMENDRKDDPETALNATEIAMAAAVAAWNQAQASDRDFETRLLRDVCQKILDLYPLSTRGGEARMRLGSVYRTMQQPLEAAKWYLQVPDTDPQYASARINAGQSYWAAWTQRAALAAEDPEVPQSTPEEMKAWKAEARNLLTQGIQFTREKTGADATPTEELVKAEVSLAMILNLDGEFNVTIERLTSGAENSVMTLIEVPEGTERPAEGIQSKALTGLAYRLLLRAYVGTQQIELALQTMTRLEKVGGQDILAAYTQLGIELQEELKRLNVAGEQQRLAQTRDSFEKFLAKVYESRDKSDYNSLLWIGETYFGLGQGVTDDAAGAEGYYAKAGDAYSEILNGGLASADNRNAVRLRLARCRRHQKQFNDAFKIAEEILVQNAMVLDAQFEAAQTLSDWGAHSEPQKLLDAIQGVKDADGKQVVWGWSTLSRRLQQITAKDRSPELQARFLDARFELSNSRRRYAAKVATDDGQEQLKSAMAEIVSFVQVYRNLDDVSFARFDRLYQNTQSDLGKEPSPLERAPIIAPPEAPVATKAAVVATGDSTAPSPAVVTSSAPDASGSGWLLPVLATSLCIGLAAGVVVFLRRPKHKVRIPGSAIAPKLQDVRIGATTGSGAAFPEFLSVDTRVGPDFASLGTVAGSSRRPIQSGAKSASGVRPTAAVSQNAAAEGRPKPAATAATPKAGTVRSQPGGGGGSISPAPGTSPSVAPKPRSRTSNPEGSPPAAKPPGAGPVAPKPSRADGLPSDSAPPAANPAGGSSPASAKPAAPKPVAPKPPNAPASQTRPKPPSKE